MECTFIPQTLRDFGNDATNLILGKYQNMMI